MTCPNPPRCSPAASWAARTKPARQVSRQASLFPRAANGVISKMDPVDRDGALPCASEAQASIRGRCGRSCVQLRSVSEPPFWRRCSAAVVEWWSILQHELKSYIAETPQTYGKTPGPPRAPNSQLQPSCVQIRSMQSSSSSVQTTKSIPKCPGVTAGGSSCFLKRLAPPSATGARHYSALVNLQTALKPIIRRRSAPHIDGAPNGHLHPNFPVNWAHSKPTPQRLGRLLNACSTRPGLLPSPLAAHPEPGAASCNCCCRRSQLLPLLFQARCLGDNGGALAAGELLQLRQLQGHLRAQQQGQDTTAVSHVSTYPAFACAPVCAPISLPPSPQHPFAPVRPLPHPLPLP